VAADLAFHRAIAAATRNKYFADFIEHLGEFAFPRRHLDPATASAYRIEDHSGRIDIEHRAILEAIRRRDSALASAEMRRHLGGSRARYKAMTESDPQGPGGGMRQDHPRDAENPGLADR
jgi:GntR family transcriptional repressor for pyruvate dehydrogenase complex